LCSLKGKWKYFHVKKEGDSKKYEFAASSLLKKTILVSILLAKLA
jgi:uncharacterized protein YPO0396